MQLNETSEAAPNQSLGLVTRATGIAGSGPTLLAVLLCCLFTLTGLIVPPSLTHDAAWGIQEWRTLEAGGPLNSIISPDPADISRDEVRRVTWWSPGQYLIPGALTRLGIRLGPALTVTAGLSLLCGLTGWVRIAAHFGLAPGSTMLLVMFIGTFRYATMPFAIYNGGEVLLQGVAPWLILVGCRVPGMGIWKAVGLAFVAICIAFFAKLTGMMVACAALFVGAMEVLVRLRRITAGMVAGAAGALLALGTLYAVWFSRGTTPASGSGWSFRFGNVFFAWAAPWGAGISWLEMVGSLLFRRNSLLRDPAATGEVSASVACLLLPPVALFAALILNGRLQNTGNPRLNGLVTTTAWFYCTCSALMSLIFLAGGDVSLEERHVRVAGMLVFFCAFAVVKNLPARSWASVSLWVVCGFMSIYGCAVFGYHVWSRKSGEVDQYSRTHQARMNANAVRYVKSALETGGRDAIFVLPSPDAACIFPPNARLLSHHVEFESEAAISARRYSGRTPGGLYVIMPTHIAQAERGQLLLEEFVDYPLDSWERHNFENTTVFVQKPLQR